MLRDSVLIVEDQATTRAVLEELVRCLDAQIHVQCCESTVDAIDWAARQAADLVLVDYRMQEIDGIELVRRLRLLPHYTHVPMVMVTVDHDPEVRYSALDAGVTDFLTKPIDLRECLARCRNLLTLRRQQRWLEDRSRQLQETVQTTTQNLHKNEFRYRSVMESSLDGFWVLSNEGRILDVNESYVRRSGYSRQELLGMRVYDFEAKQSPDEVSRSLATYEHRGARIFETWHRAKDGTLWPVEVSTVSVPDDGLYCTFLRDISERKRAEATQATLAAIVGSTNDAIIGRSLDGTIISWNAAAERLLGYTAEEAIGTDGAAIFPAARLEEILANRELIKAGQAVPDQESVDITKNGRRVNVLRSIFPIKGADGLIVGTGTILRDISERKRAEATQATLAAIVANSNDAIIGRGLDGKIISWNAAAERMLGYSATEVIGTDSEAIFVASQREEVLANRELIKAGKSVPDRDAVRIAKDGRHVEVTVSILPIKESSGLLIGTAVVLRDITERKRSEQALARESLKNKLFLHNSSDGIHIVDADGKVMEVSNSFCDMLGYTREELIGANITLWDAQWTPDELKREIRKQLDAHGRSRFETSHKRRDGSFIDVEIMGQRLALDGQEMLFNSSRDITEHKRAQKRIEFLAHKDILTALPNRVLFMDRMEQAMAHSVRDRTKVALLFLDLDHFKTINDSLGHPTGDRLLKTVALELQGCVRESDTVSRQGGDEFLIMLPTVRDTEAVMLVVDKLMKRFEQPFDVEGDPMAITVSIGVAVHPEDGTDFEALLKNADMAMYKAKDAGRNTYRFYDNAMHVEAVEHLHIRNGLRAALDDRQFVLHYQPQIDLHTGTVIGAEALVRWNNPKHGIVLPGRFIHVAEESGLIVAIGDWVLREACRQMQAWRDAGLPPMVVAVNLSAVQFKRGDLERLVMRALEESGLNPSQLDLELTESILIRDTERTLATVRRLKALGVKLSIDDFGTGYSSLSYLKRFAVDKLKIDRSFIGDLADNPEDATIVRAIVQMAHSLGLRTLAEGVEEESVIQYLRLYNCDEAQGYHFARPLPATEFASYVKIVSTAH